MYLRMCVYLSDCGFQFGGQLFAGVRKCSVFDVVAWHGNYAPFKYNLELFCCMNSVT